MKKAAFFAVMSVLALALATCATRAPNRPAAMKELPTALPKPQAPEPAAAPEPKEPFVNQVVTLSFTLPPGWDVSVQSARRYMSRIYFIGHAQDGIIILLAYPTAEGKPLDVVKYLDETDRSRSQKVSSITASGDGNAARQIWWNRSEKRRGIVEAKILKDDSRVSVVLIGSWPANHGRERSRDFDEISSSVKFE